MRLRVFAADSVTEAMRQIRRELGDDAVIVSTQSDDDGSVRITAALAASEPDDDLEELLASDRGEDMRQHLHEALAYHGVHPGLAAAILDGTSMDSFETPEQALESALAGAFDFEPIALDSHRPLMLLGTPGAGKTLCAVKLATRAVMEKRRLAIVTADGVRAGAHAQLSAFTDILEAQLLSADGPRELRQALDHVPAGAVTLIDTTGANPFAAGEMAALARLIEASGAEPVLVCAAGGDAIEAAEMASAFAAIGVHRLMVTRLDIARRLGAMLALADAGPFAFSNVSFSPQVARGMRALGAHALSRLLLRDPHQAVHDITLEKAALS